MAKIADHVNPGDLIKSSLINLILDKFSSLDDRVSALEGGASASGAVVITGISPSGSIRVGQTISVSGQNFGFSIGAQQVFIDSVQVTVFNAGSNDQQLIFSIPTTITDVPPSGRSATLSIGNGLPPKKVPIFLVPAFTLGGGVDVNYLGTITGAITANQQATFQFSIKSRANFDGVFAIQPLVSGPANAQDWNNNLQVLDDSKNVISSMTIPLFAGQQKTFYVTINPVPLGATGSFDLGVTASAAGGAASGGSGSITFTVGQTPPQPDTTITMNLQLQSVAILPATGGSVSQTQIQLQSGAQAVIPFQAIFTVIGSYDISVALTSGSNWNVGLFGTSTPIPIGAADLANPSKSASKNLGFSVSPGANASAKGKVEFRVQNHGATTLCAVPMDLQLG